MQEVKEIWYVDQYVGHPKYGNVYRNFYLAKELQKKGLKVKIFTGSYSHLMYNFPSTIKSIEKEVLEGIEFYWVKVKKYKGGQSLGRIRAIFEFMLRLWGLRKFSPPDVIITPSLSMIPIWMVFFLRKFVWKKDIKIIFEVRDIWPLTLTTLGKKSVNHPFVRLLAYTERKAYEKSDYIISTLRMCDEHIQNIVNTEFKFKWIDNGINNEITPAIVPAEIRLKVPEDKFIIAYTGSLGIANAMRYFVEAAAILESNSELHFLIIGDGTERMKLEEQAMGLENITFIGKIRKDYIQGILSLCDILYFSFQNAPDLYKFGVSANKTYEYMLSAKPIILSCVDMDYNIIKDANCGLVIRPENPELIVEAINELYTMTEDERTTLGENGRKYILENNTFDILADKLIDVFHDLEV